MRKNFFEARDVCIVAYGETKIDRATGKNAYELSAEVAAELFSKTGLKPAQVDGLALTKAHSEAPNPFYSNYMADYLGLTTRWIQVTDIGGAYVIGNIARATLALQNGL